MSELAFIIPFYKKVFFEQTLISLINQTCKDFVVYIGDDNSPDNIDDLISEYSKIINIKFKRFESNLGNKSLVAHWQRCIDMIENEPWIWILPDDDYLENNCVEQFFLKKNNYSDFDVFRFITSFVDFKGDIYFNPPKPPPIEKGIEFLLSKWKFERSSTIAEYVFRKSKFNEVGGFKNIPLAWGSDDILWFELSTNKGLCLIDSAKVFLRQSGVNISSQIQSRNIQLTIAKYNMLEYLYENKLFMEELKTSNIENQLTTILTKNIFFDYRSYDIKFNVSIAFKFAKYNSRFIGGNLLINLYRIFLFILKKK